MNVGQALATPTTGLAKAAAQTAAARTERIAKAREIAAKHGITLEQALLAIHSGIEV